MKTPTQSAYIKKAETTGDYCPLCGHDNPQGDGFEWNNAILREMLFCPECSAVWAAEYKRTGFAVLELEKE